MPISLEVDDENERVFMTITGGATGAQVARRIAEHVECHPQARRWDWVQDVRLSTGEVTVADINAVARTFAPGDVEDCWTVFVSMDRNLGLWLPSMDLMFKRRKHLSAITIEQAVADLDVLRGRIPAARAS